MKIEITKEFFYLLDLQVDYIAKDKPKAARRFKSDLLRAIKKDLKHPYNYKKSIYFDNEETFRDYVFKGYTIVYYINITEEKIQVFEFVKYMDSL